jgi:predicted methyltransferase
MKLTKKQRKFKRWLEIQNRKYKLHDFDLIINKAYDVFIHTRYIDPTKNPTVITFSSMAVTPKRMMLNCHFRIGNYEDNFTGRKFAIEIKDKGKIYCDTHFKIG